MRVLIVSDTHRKHENYLEAVRKNQPLDLVIHCGDVEGGEYVISEAAGCPVEIVQGNNDYFCDLPREKEVQLGKYKAMVVHGHQYGVNMGYERLADEARSRGMDMVMYGHTHRPVLVKEKGVLVINPGSLTYPRQEGRRHSYALMEIKAEGEPRVQIIYL
ncbi:MAG: metallophosphoesterase [Lachnospiraceae bacterium]|nr:metallophosphoesterase [Lachnospiraceae bacterium]